MKITAVNNPLPTVTPATERRGAAPQPGATPAEASAKVQLSAAAKAALQGAEGGSFDAAKVERMTQAIKDGSFQPNPEAIADKLIANAREQLAKTYR